MKINWWIKIYDASINQKKVEVAILTLDNTNFREKKKVTDQQEQCNDKGSILQEDTAILNVYTSNNRAAKHVKQKLIELKGEMNPVLSRDFNIPFITIDRTIGQKVSKDIEELSNTISHQGI